MQVTPDLALSRSYTSRAVRPGETDGIDYNFITRARFEEMIAAERLPRVGGRLRQPLRHLRRGRRARAGAGRDLVLVIDVQGARQVRVRCPDTVGVFVLPPSFEVLEQRLRGRSKDSEEAMQRRLRPRATKSPRSSSTTTSSSTTSSTRASSGCARSCWRSGRGCGRCASPAERIVRVVQRQIRGTLNRGLRRDREKPHQRVRVRHRRRRPRQAAARGCTPKTTGAEKLDRSSRRSEVRRRQGREGSASEGGVAE